MLLLAQAACVALAMWPLARIAARRVGTRGVWLAAAAWLLYPNLGHVATYEFHPGTLAVLPMAWAYDGLDRGKLSALAWSCLAVLACREDLGAFCVLIALLAYAQRPDPRALWLALACLALQRTRDLAGGAARAANGSARPTLRRLGRLAAGRLPRHRQRPGARLGALRNPRTADLSAARAGAAFVVLPACAQAAPARAALFGAQSDQYVPHGRRAVLALPHARGSRDRGLGLGGSCASTVPDGAGALVRHAWPSVFTPWVVCRSHETSIAPHSKPMRTRSPPEPSWQQIPANASVQAPDPLLPHLAGRRSVYRAPPPERGTDYVVLDISHRQRFAKREDLLRTLEEPPVRSWSARADHALIVYAPPYALFARGQDPRASAVVASAFKPAAGQAFLPLKLTECLSVDHVAREGGTIVLGFIAHGPCPADLALYLGPSEIPARTDLLFGGVLSPAHLRAGDRLRSEHVLSPREQKIYREDLYISVLRQNGARPAPSDPKAVHLRLR